MCVCRKQCIELEQQFDFLKDLVAAVPDMQGEGEENHAEALGDKVSRRYTHARASFPWGRLFGAVVFFPPERTVLWLFWLRRGRKPGSGRKNGGTGAKGKDKKLSGTDSEQEVGGGARRLLRHLAVSLNPRLCFFFFSPFATAATGRLRGQRDGRGRGGQLALERKAAGGVQVPQVPICLLFYRASKLKKINKNFSCRVVFEKK